MRILIVIVLVISLGHTKAQSSLAFVKSFGNSGYDFSRDVHQDMDTGYVMCGSSSSFAPDNAEAYLLKLNKFGQFVWSHNYGGTGTDWAEELVITHDSTYALAGHTNSFGAGGYDFYLVRADSMGVPLWEKTYGGSDWDRAYGLVQLADSGYVLVGESYSWDGIQKAYAVRTDKNGDTLWTYTHYDPEPSFFKGIARDGDSLVMCGGIGDGGTNSYNGLVMKMHIDGTIDWTQNVGQGNNDYLNSCYYVNGVYSMAGVRSYDYANSGEDMWMYRVYADGSLYVDTTFVNATPEKDGLNDAVARGFDQDYYFIGYTASMGFLLDGKPDVIMAKMTSSHVQFAGGNFGEAGDDIGYGINHTFDGGVVVCGDTKFWSTGGTNAFMMKIPGNWWYPTWFTDVTYEDMTNSILDYASSTPLGAYPNPVEDVINFPAEITGHLYIHDLAGKEVYSSAKTPNKIDLSFLSPGNYILNVESDQKLFQQRIVKL